MPLTLNATGVVVVDDGDANIIYQGPWRRSGVKEEYNVTSHGTFFVGATATFNFNGTAIAVYGTVSGCTSTYALDDSSPVTFTGPDASLVGDTHQILFYQSPYLQETQHRLVITSLANNSDHSFWLDYLVYQPLTQTSSTTSNTSSSSSTDSSVSAKAFTKRTAVMGGVTGGLLFLLLAVIFVLYFRGRRGFASASKKGGLTTNSASKNIYPFPLTTFADTGMQSNVSFRGPWFQQSGHLNPISAEQRVASKKTGIPYFSKHDIHTARSDGGSTPSPTQGVPRMPVNAPRSLWQFVATPSDGHTGSLEAPSQHSSAPVSPIQIVIPSGAFSQYSASPSGPEYSSSRTEVTAGTQARSFIFSDRQAEISRIYGSISDNTTLSPQTLRLEGDIPPAYST